MILTGAEIERQVAKGRIVLSPFHEDQINPNSYNYRLGPTMKAFSGMEEGAASFIELPVPDEGLVLQPNTLYLAHTYETIGSDRFAMSLIGRSSMGRLGLFLQVSANLGHTTSAHRWTLELHTAHPLRVYPKMVIGQVSFWRNLGTVEDLGKTYALIDQPHEAIRSAYEAGDES